MSHFFKKNTHGLISESHLKKHSLINQLVTYFKDNHGLISESIL